MIGMAAVLTARHVVAGALDQGRILARVVKPGIRTDWVPMTVLVICLELSGQRICG